METSGEIGERVVVTIRCDYSDGFSNHNLFIDAHEDSVSKAGV